MLQWLKYMRRSEKDILLTTAYLILFGRVHQREPWVQRPAGVYSTRSAHRFSWFPSMMIQYVSALLGGVAG
jgi:hypothetical protein